MSRPVQQPSVVVYVNGGSYHHDVPAAVPAPSGALPDFAAGPQGGIDPYEAHRIWPGLWAGFLKQAFRGPMITARISMAFQVDDRTARKWLAGEGGCKAHHVRVAMQRDPALAMRTLFDMAAE